MVTFLFDHPSRDLLPYNLIGCQLNCKYKLDFQDGYFTPLGPNFFERVSDEEKILVTPSYNITRTPYIRLRKRFKNSKLLMLHSEQLLAPVSYYEKFNLDNFKKFNRDVSLHLVWNDSFKNLLVEHGVDPDKVKVVGNPKFDILKSLRNSLDNPDKNENILFITNFNAADSSDEEWALLREEYFLDKNDHSNRYYQDIRRNFLESIKEIEDTCRKLGKKIIIRKHPGEVDTSYNEIVSDVVKVSTEPELYKDLISAQLVFQFTSSVVFESYLLGIATYAIKWGDLPAELMQPPSEEFYWHDPSELNNIVLDHSKYKEAIDNNLFVKLFGQSSEYASSVIAREINELVSDIEEKERRKNYLIFASWPGLKFIFKYLINLWAVRGKGKVSAFFHSKITNSYKSWMANDHYCTKADIEVSRKEALKVLRNDCAQ